MNVPRTNVDLAFKESLSIFKGKVLDFLGLTGIPPITEHLATESVKIEVTWEFADLAFGTQDGRGLHVEEEIDLSDDDQYRFAGYNLSLSRVHKREFITVIFVKNPTKLTGIKTEQLEFKPIIVQCSEIDADAILAKLRKAIADGKPINELEAIYLPLFHSKSLSPTELFVESAELVKAIQAEDKHKLKVLTLLATLCGKVVDPAQLTATIEEVRMKGNKIFEYLEERAAERREEEILRNLIVEGLDSPAIIKATGVSEERLRVIRASLHKEAV